MKWEYRIEKDLPSEELDRLGLSGWELCSVAVKDGVSRFESTKFYFKRPKIERTAPDELPASEEG